MIRVGLRGILWEIHKRGSLQCKTAFAFQGFTVVRFVRVLGHKAFEVRDYRGSGVWGIGLWGFRGF